MIPYTQMNEYVRQAIEKYEKEKTDYEQAFQSFYEFSHQFIIPEQILLQYGWHLIIKIPNRSLAYKCSAFRTYYSQEYDLRIDIYFKTNSVYFDLDWFINGISNPKKQDKATSFALYFKIRW